MFENYEEGEHDPFDDWYEKALRDGMGFKNDEERQEYIRNMGDIEKVPYSYHYYLT